MGFALYALVYCLGFASALFVGWARRGAVDAMLGAIIASNLKQTYDRQAVEDMVLAENVDPDAVDAMERADRQADARRLRIAMDTVSEIRGGK